ncbi:unnamed protein product [Hyaloperonospora brassicae]|uniref:Uncharacterized protein n=1 Tax=Hyaloperonospora brassicae TaxID=162125 RepID=A0AAV0TT63_HYABA|nr:unnamed protein product [Hyaloperonospora brassicae]
MGRKDDDEEYVMYTIVTCPATDELPAATAKIKIPNDFSEDLDEELWSLTERRDETIQALSRQLKELVRLLAELPMSTKVIPEVQKFRFFKRAMPKDSHDKVAAADDHCDKLTALVLYFERL